MALSKMDIAKAAELSLAILWDYGDYKEAITWSDDLIMSLDEIDDSIFELSTCSDRNEAIAHLNVLAKGADRWEALTLFFGRFSNLDVMAPQDASALAKKLYFECAYDDAPERFTSLLGYWDDIDLAIDGSVGDPQQLATEFLKDLKEIALNST